MQKWRSNLDPLLLKQAWEIKGKIWEEEAFWEPSETIISEVLDYLKSIAERCLRIINEAAAEDYPNWFFIWSANELLRLCRSAEELEPNNNGFSVMSRFKNRLLWLIMSDWLHRLINLASWWIAYMQARSKWEQNSEVNALLEATREDLNNYIKYGTSLEYRNVTSKLLENLLQRWIVKKLTIQNIENRGISTIVRILWIIFDELLRNAYKYGKDLEININYWKYCVKFCFRNIVREPSLENFSSDKWLKIINDAVQYLGGNFVYIWARGTEDFETIFTLPYSQSQSNTGKKKTLLLLQ